MLYLLLACAPDPVSPTAPLLGGGLALDRDQIWLSDPDGDQLLRLQRDGTPLDELPVPPSSVPNRIGVGERTVAVVLRQAAGEGALLLFDRERPREGELLPVCREPRGLEVDGGEAWVACAEGELVLVDLDQAKVLRRLTVEPDLRDVLLSDGALWVTLFRKAELLRVDPQTGEVLERQRPVPVDADTMIVNPDIDPFVPFAAYRTVHDPRGGLVMLHQRGADGAIDLQPDRTTNPYVDFVLCGSDVVHSAVTWFHGDGRVTTSRPVPGVGVPVDLAAAEDGLVAVAMSAMEGNEAVAYLLREDEVQPLEDASLMEFDCEPPASVEAGGAAHGAAVTFLDGEPLVATRFPLALEGARHLLLRSEDAPMGFDLFHRAAPGGIACASCHPEGHEDGRTWRFVGLGPRRTQELAGIGGTAPFHWDGDLESMDALLAEVHVRRMGASADEVGAGEALAAFLDSIPPLRPARPADPALAARGEVLFTSRGCTDCHSDTPPPEGFDVGTGGLLQAPRLRGVASRLPLMHDGCAETLHDRFEPDCGGALHGEALAEDEIDALVAWLSTL
jgi:hypothetical protein